MACGTANAGLRESAQTAELQELLDLAPAPWFNATVAEQFFSSRHFLHAGGRYVAQDQAAHLVRAVGAGMLLDHLAAALLAEDVPTAELPITRIVLFNSGVGFFEHNGKVDGDRRVELKFRTDDVNDLLKSMVLQDLGGGQVSAVTYDSREPMAHTLKTFTIDLTESPTLADLLQQVRGERIQIEAPQSLEGVIVGVESRTVIDHDTQVDKSFLDLKTDNGLRCLPMDSIVQYRLTSKKLNAELDEALALLAAARAMDKKTVNLEFRGQGQREVRVGYIQESPVWKTSYRLVLNGEKPPFLQGWAIVENTGDEDWNQVQLSLVSGRPISFIMDLYQPLFVAGPPWCRRK